MNSMYIMMGWIVAMALLGVVFVAGIVLLIIGLVTRAQAKNQVPKRSPKVLIGIALAMMILPVLVSGILVASGLSSVYREVIEPVPAYVQVQDKLDRSVDELLAAADAGDVDGIYTLFSETTRQNEPELKEEIEEFLDAYPGRPDSMELLIALTAGRDYPAMDADGETVVQTNAKYKMTKDGVNYYFQVIIGVVDEVNPEDVGVKNIAIQSELAACRDENWYPYSEGWSKACAVFVQIDVDENIETRCIEGVPVIFERYGRTITEKMLRDFLEESTSLSEFRSEFGEPNADNGEQTCYYELASNSGSTRYAKIFFEEETDQILDESSIISESGFMSLPLLEPRKMGDEEPSIKLGQ